MAWMKQIDLLANEIGDILLVNPNSVNLGQVSQGWLADVLYNGSTLEGDIKNDPIEAMKSLLEKARQSKTLNGGFRAAKKILSGKYR